MSAYSDKVTGAAERAHVIIAAVADDMANGFPMSLKANGGSKGLPSYLRRQARRLREALKALDDEGAMLAAGACEHRLGNEHGNAYCGKTGELL